MRSKYFDDLTFIPGNLNISKKTNFDECQRSPKTKWGFPSVRSCAPMLTTVQPMAEAGIQG